MQREESSETLPEDHSSGGEVHTRAEGGSGRQHAQRAGSERLLDRRALGVCQASVVECHSVRNRFLSQEDGRCPWKVERKQILPRVRTLAHASLGKVGFPAQGKSASSTSTYVVAQPKSKAV